MHLGISRDKNPVILTPGEELDQLGVSEADIDDAISALDTAFSQPVADIFTDTTIEPAFTTLQLTIPETSPLYQTGEDWFNHNGPLNIGTDAPAPTSMDDFWYAFRLNGLCDWDNYGIKVSCGLGLFLPVITR